MKAKVRAEPLSLNLRVMSFIALAFGLSLLLIGYMVQNAVMHHFAEQDADEMAVITQAVETALKRAQTQQQAPATLLDNAVSGHHGVYFQVWDQHHQLVFGDEAISGLPAPFALAPMEKILPDNLYHWQLAATRYSGSVRDINVDGLSYRVVVAIDAGFHLSFLKSFRSTLWSIMLLTGVATLLAAWYGVYRGLAPLRQLSQLIGDVGAQQLDLRLTAEHYPKELQALARSFNEMLARIEQSFTQLSHFSDDIAHELRTPLTNIITQTQVALAKSRTLDEYRELHYSTLEELEHLSRMVNDMLWLAKSEQGLQRPADEPIHIAAEVSALFEFFEALAEEKHISLQLRGDVAGFCGDRMMFRRALSNLLSNAIRYAPVSSTVRVDIDQTDSCVRIGVANTGPQIADEHLPRLFDRFFRADPARQRTSDGTGLGLAIVKSIAEQHQGEISVVSNANETRFILKLPLANPLDN